MAKDNTLNTRIILGIFKTTSSSGDKVFYPLDLPSIDA